MQGVNCISIGGKLAEFSRGSRSKKRSSGLSESYNVAWSKSYSISTIAPHLSQTVVKLCGKVFRQLTQRCTTAFVLLGSVSISLLLSIAILSVCSLLAEHYQHRRSQGRCLQHANDPVVQTATTTIVHMRRRSVCAIFVERTCFLSQALSPQTTYRIASTSASRRRPSLAIFSSSLTNAPALWLVQSLQGRDRACFYESANSHARPPGPPGFPRHSSLLRSFGLRHLASLPNAIPVSFTKIPVSFTKVSPR